MRFPRRFLIAILFLCLGCAAQANSPEVNQRIERQVRAYLSDRIPSTVNIAVGARTPSSDFPGYDKVAVTLSQGERKQDLEFLVSKDGNSLVRVLKFDLTKDPYAETMKKIDIAGRPVRGNKDAAVTIVNFDDLQCPFCARMHAQLANEVLKMYGNSVRIIYKDFPLTEIHPWAVHAANDANCVAAQSPDGYWQFVDFAHANQKQITGDDQKPPYTRQFALLDKTATSIGERLHLQMAPLEACIKTQPNGVMLKSRAEGAALGLTSTPVLFVNGEKVDGAVSLPELQATINRALRDAGQPLPAAALEAQKSDTSPENQPGTPAPPAKTAPAPSAAPGPK